MSKNCTDKDKEWIYKVLLYGVGGGGTKLYINIFMNMYKGAENIVNLQCGVKGSGTKKKGLSA